MSLKNSFSRKTKASVVALLLVASVAVTCLALPATYAHEPPLSVPTWSYVAVTSNPIGVNQEMVIIFWLDKVPPTANGAYGDRWTFYLDISKPDGSEQTLGPITSDPVGSAYQLYTPDQIGTYSVAARFIGLTITGLPLNPAQTTATATGAATVGDDYLASTSDPQEFVVQKDPIQPWAETPLPTEYWTRPINTANRYWSGLAANWLAGAATDVGPTARFSYGTAPESAHIMWATPMWAGGIMDARYGDIGYETSHYEGLNFDPPIILNGRIYYNVMSHPREGWYCIDLYTGETEYFFNSTGPATGQRQSSSGSMPQQRLAFGQILNYNSPNQHGGFPYLWSTSGPDNTWMMYDAETGNYICSIANVSSSGTAVYGKDGSILRYSIAGTGENQYLRVWNTTHAIWWSGTQQQWDNGPDYSVFQSNNYWLWRPSLNITYDGNNGFSLNVSLADNPLTVTTIRAVREDQYVIGGSPGSNNENGVVNGYLWALNLDSTTGKMGKLLWNVTFVPPSSAGAKTVNMGTVDPEDGVFFFECLQTRERWGYSLETGQMLWGPSKPEPGLNIYGSAEMYGMNDNIYEGKLLSYAYGGELIAYNVTTGEILWKYVATNEGFESPYGNYPISISCIGDGKLYLVSNEHSPSQPLWRGSNIRCINATDGTEIWKILNWGQQQTGAGMTVLADGYLVSLNLYDARIYCYGKGPSETTVAASPNVAVQGSEILITGTVTDQSVGKPGIPAIADEDQEVWMEYQYMQQSKPTDVEGVPVHLTAIDPNSNFQDIGTVVSDMKGIFATSWTPPVPGVYTITATFDGSKSYYMSDAETKLLVSETASAPVVAPTQQPTQPIASPNVPTPTQVQSVSSSPLPSEAPQPATSAGTPTWTYIAIGAAVIVIVAVAAVLILRRRK
ncbi:MAG: hypothetical protein NWF00_03295 [Candidatus Bathyarchaeota archaeon]|nr:hypothetical protein [Candidatus Bathyarchaeota archaeon]